MRDTKYLSPKIISHFKRYQALYNKNTKTPLVDDELESLINTSHLLIRELVQDASRMRKQVIVNDINAIQARQK